MIVLTAGEKKSKHFATIFLTFVSILESGSIDENNQMRSG